ncbi:mitochondrial carrier [Macrolepiota fuliginosa MF-IS2]|uniref:Mitochondrial carrier n=1 Tax=Macrolepiota fuliginosa MF-IS2 TaxID=1400762 RepID=A0A9P6C039_9AGAR|nr:mitochondrial carrier [Macrolepiota fuliginosa MF-IS2]
MSSTIDSSNTSTQSPQSIPARMSPSPLPPHPHSLGEFRQAEGRENRKRRLLALWNRLPPLPQPKHHPSDDKTPKPLGPGGLTYEKAESLRATYDDELLVHCKGLKDKEKAQRIGWEEFKEYAKTKEVELWHIFHDELDLDSNGQLDTEELRTALNKSGIQMSPEAFSEFMSSLTVSPHSHHITFAEFRDFLLLLPRRASPDEIYRYYEVVRFMGDDGRGPARVTMEGDVSLSAEDKPPDSMIHKHTNTSATNLSASGSQQTPSSSGSDTHSNGVEYLEDGDEGDHQSFLERHTSLRFLLAGGIAGIVSRTCTAPFDRLKVFLITRSPDLGGVPAAGKMDGIGGVRVISSAVARIYSEGGILAFWTGNGLSVAKIFPESAIKFFAYESAKRAFAQYWDHVDDPREISSVSRFLSGGIGGISSQLSIYPLETLKTQMMSNAGMKRTFLQAARHLYGLGGLRAYYRGLTVGLIGVFPYSAIDMSTFEALKLTYVQSTGKEEPGVLALLAFGSISGSVGATSVYPLNLVRTRLQASGSSGHPQRYTGVWDVTVKTWERDGWRGFYRGLFPTLAKVVPAVSISYVVYEHSKRKLGV